MTLRVAARVSFTGVDRRMTDARSAPKTGSLAFKEAVHDLVLTRSLTLFPLGKIVEKQGFPLPKRQVPVLICGLCSRSRLVPCG